MPASGRRFLSLALTVCYWMCSVYLLYRTFPIFVDGSGATATFHWGSSFLVSNLTSFEHDIHTRLRFFGPYWLAASIITFVGCGVPMWSLRSSVRSSSSLFLRASATTLAPLLVLGAISDIGVSFGLWRGPRMYDVFYNLFTFLSVFVPMSLFAGILAILRARLDEVTSQA
jgi:hypothetical protein